MNSPRQSARTVGCEWRHGRGKRSWLVSTLLLVLAVPVSAADLQDVQFSALPGNQVQVQLTLSGPIAQPQTFATESPARIAMDLPGVNSRLASKSVPIGLGPVHSLVAVEASDRTRVVLNLTDPVPYEVSTSGNQVTIKIAARGRAAPPPPAAAQTVRTGTTVDQATARTDTPAWSQPPRSRQSAGAGPAVRDIDFRRGSTGEGRIVIRLPSPDTRVAVREQASRVYVDLYQTSLPQRLYRRLDVVDFATPVTMVESRPNGSNVEIEVQTQGDFDYMAYQTDELFTLDFRALTVAEKEEIARQKVVYDGERLSLNFQDIEVRAVLQVLADFTDLNLVASDTVGGNITLRLKNVPWDQALDIILKTKGLAMRQNGNVLMVAPAQELAAQEQLEMESMQKIEELAPLRTEFIQVNYAKAADIAAVLSGAGRAASNPASPDARQTGTATRRDQVGASGLAQVAAAAGVSDRGILSPRGSLTFDERTNTLIVQDTLTALEEVRRVVNLLDVAVRQVMIESRVVIANNSFARDLGVRFGVSGSMGKVGDNEVLIGGGQNGYLAVGDYDSGPFGLNASTGTPYNSTLTDDAGNATLITNLPATTIQDAASGSIDFLIGKVGSYLIQLELSAMQREGRGEIISSPRVITADKNKATIKVGSEIPYQEQSGQGNTSIAFKEAVLQLDVTPQITPDDRIIMDLEVRKDRPDWSRSINNTPPIDTRSVKTNVVIDNGETVVLGGVFEREKTFSKEQVPWLGDVPVLGRLFKQEARQDSNTELLIFVTPKILKSDLVER
ncbi:type IV pilus secretin PilQ [Allochromatium vinosum]|uniref:Type IV pilus secretin PilQ n=1 Tax=Allochromatium vinosum (strain ATCC 17899 / DSM 180 / NBRC 103801 / NCIMB 10441 / D) TaxID=572477 RepID=D3RS21_ALLVD|nr:type IV pilus secretin PilQ [Allochromatium vinosum]ADC63958.1 type IV pilus secretin PilQ [Allochromatium vinosum DSM 180]